MIKPVIETQNPTRLATCLLSQSVVESKFAQSEEISEILAVYPQVSLISCEVASGRVNYSGRLICTIVYADTDGKLCRMQKGAEFSHYADSPDLAPAQTAICRLNLLKTQLKRDGSSYVVSVIVGADIAVFAVGERNALVDCEGVITNCEEQKFFNCLPFTGESQEEDFFDAESVADILLPCAQVVALSCSCLTAQIAVEGEIYLSLLAMRGDSPVCMDRVIPFKATIPLDDAHVGGTASVAVSIKDLNVSATVNEERGKCQINVVCNLAFAGVLYEENRQKVVTDCFSTTNNLNITTASENLSPVTEIKSYAERVAGNASSKDKLNFTCRFFAAAMPYAEYSYIQDSNTLDGSVCATLIYESGGELKSTEVNLPFSLPLGEGGGSDYVVAVCGVNLKQQQEGLLEGEAVLKISCNQTSSECARYVCAIEEGELLPQNASAISVIVPQAGEGLWEVSKRLLLPPEEVQKSNPDVTYPANGNERVVVYRRK